MTDELMINELMTDEAEITETGANGGGLGKMQQAGGREALRQEEAGATFSYEALYELLRQRRAERPEGSYTSYLFDKGIDKILKKLGEECTEVIIAAKGGSRAETLYELADLVYHAMVLMVELELTPAALAAELATRHVIDTKEKQETRASAVLEAEK